MYSIVYNWIVFKQDGKQSWQALKWVSNISIWVYSTIDKAIMKVCFKRTKNVCRFSFYTDINHYGKGLL